MHFSADALPYLDKALPGAWKAARELSTVIANEALQLGLTRTETELIKVRASQINGCVFCLDLHSRLGRQAGVTQQQLNLLAVWRGTPLFNDREAAVLAIAEAATVMPLGANSRTELLAARSTLGDKAFVAAEWVAATINVFNRISILSEHQARPRDAEGKTH